MSIEVNPFNMNALSAVVAANAAMTKAQDSDDVVIYESRTDSNLNMVNHVLASGTTFDRVMDRIREVAYSGITSDHRFCNIVASSSELSKYSAHPERPSARDGRVEVTNRFKHLRDGEESHVNNPQGGKTIYVHVYVGADGEYHEFISQGNTRIKSWEMGSHAEVKDYEVVVILFQGGDAKERSNKVFYKDDSLDQALTKAQKLSHSLENATSSNVPYFDKQVSMLVRANTAIAGTPYHSEIKDDPLARMGGILASFEGVDLLEIRGARAKFDYSGVITSPGVIQGLIQFKSRKGADAGGNFASFFNGSAVEGSGMMHELVVACRELLERDDINKLGDFNGNNHKVALTTVMSVLNKY